MPHSRFSLPIFGTFFILFCLALDQLTKYWVRDEIDFFFQQNEITPFLNFVFVLNEGVSFGFLSDLPFEGQWPLITLTLLLVGLLFFWMLKSNNFLQEISFWRHYWRSAGKYLRSLCAWGRG